MATDDEGSFARYPVLGISSSPTIAICCKVTAVMLRYQGTLPPLPVPTLESTVAKYLDSLQPLQNESDARYSRKAATDFLKPDGIGQTLQRRLLEYATKADGNWLHDWKLDDYLVPRTPIVPYVNYFAAWKDLAYPMERASQAATICILALEFMKQIDEDMLEPDMRGNSPLCMEQYSWIFHTCRIPQLGKDRIAHFSHSHNKHIAVCRKNSFFKIPYEFEGKIVNARELAKQMEAIYVAGEESPNVGILTAENRDIWALARQELVNFDPQNVEVLNMIESAAFLLCLDEESPISAEERARHFWHSGGPNRWFDKTTIFILCDNGAAGYMGEHSMVDGLQARRLNEYLLQGLHVRTFDFANMGIRHSLPMPKRYDFILSLTLHEKINCAMQNFQDCIDSHELSLLSYTKYGSNCIRTLRLSPDSWVQMIMQLAYYRFSGTFAPTYEAQSTRLFRRGRTEVIRSLSSESVAFCKSMSASDISVDVKVSLFREACGKHSRTSAAAAKGQGVDRHLFGLSQMIQPREEVPDLFRDLFYTSGMRWILSTTQVSGDYADVCGCAQVEEEGFGIAYMVLEKRLLFSITSKKKGSEKIAQYIRVAADEVAQLFASSCASTKSEIERILPRN